MEKERNLARQWNMAGGIGGGILFTFLTILLVRKIIGNKKLQKNFKLAKN